MNAVNDDIHCEIKNGLIVGNVCDHADKYLFLCHLSENLKTEKKFLINGRTYVYVECV